MLLAIFLRCWNLEITPGWWPDEGAYLDIAWNLTKGIIQEGPVRYTFVPHPPLYFLSCYLPLIIFGKSIIVTRAVSTIYGVITTLVVYSLGKELKNKYLGYLAAFAYAIFPMALIVGRMTLTYQLFTLLASLVLLFLIKYTNNKKNYQIVWAAIFASLATVTSFFGISLIFIVAVSTIIFDRKSIFKVLLVCGLFPLLYALAMILYDEKTFISALTVTFSRNDIQEAANSIWLYYVKMFSFHPFGALNVWYNYFFYSGILGLLFFQGKKRAIIISFFVILTLFEFRFRGFWWYIVSYSFLLTIGTANLILASCVASKWWR